MSGEELHWTLAFRSLIVGHSFAIPLASDMRLYNINPLLERGFESDDLISETAINGVYIWERPGVSIESVGGLLKVRTDYRSHDLTESLLNRALNLAPAKLGEYQRLSKPSADLGLGACCL